MDQKEAIKNDDGYRECTMCGDWAFCVEIGKVYICKGCIDLANDKVQEFSRSINNRP